MSLQVGKSVQKRRASKSKAVEQLAEKTIVFNESIASLSGEGVAVGDTEPGKADSKPGVQRTDVHDSKGQGKRQPEVQSEANGKKVSLYHLPDDAMFCLLVVMLWQSVTSTSMSCPSMETT